MEQNFTPLDMTSIKKKDAVGGMLLLSIATITAFVLALMLLILIQKKLGMSNI